MPTTFFAQPRTTKERIELKIEECKGLLVGMKSLEKENFLSRLRGRIIDFDRELLGSNDQSSEKRWILEQYSRFANTLHLCLHHPQHAERYISHYHMNKYYPVGVHDIAKPNPLWEDLAWTGIIMTLGMLGTSAAALFLFSNPITAAVILVLACTILFPSCFYLLLPDSPDTDAKKAQEKSLFQMGARLVDDKVVFAEEASNYELLQYTNPNPVFA